MDYPWIPPLCTVDIHVSSMDIHTTWDPLVKVFVDDNVTMYIHGLSLDTTTMYCGHPCIIHGCPHYLGPLVKVSVDDKVTMYIHGLSLDIITTTNLYCGHPCITHYSWIPNECDFIYISGCS